MRMRGWESYAVLTFGVAAGLLAGAAAAMADVRAHGNSFCALKYHEQTSPIVVPDHSSADNTPVGDLTVTKNCTGPVIGTLSVEITGRLHLHEIIAQCISDGGIQGGCTTGTKIDVGYPAVAGEHKLLYSDGVADVTYPIATIQLIWPNLARGQWRFYVLPACSADCPVTIQKSYFRVEAYHRR